MRTRLLPALLILSGCSLSNDFEAPFPAPDAAPGDQGVPVDLSLDGGVPDGAVPDAADSDQAPADLGDPDGLASDRGLVDAGGPDVALPDATLTDAAIPDAALADAAVPDAEPPCEDGVERALPCGEAAWVRAICEGERWVEGACAAQAPFPCGAVQYREDAVHARYVYRPNLLGRSLFHPVEASLSWACDGCSGALDGVFDRVERLTAGADGRAQRRDVQVGDRTGYIEFGYQADQVSAVHYDSAGAVVQTDRHLVAEDPRRIERSLLNVTGDAPLGTTRMIFVHGLTGAVRLTRTEGDSALERRYRYDLDGRWWTLGVYGADEALVEHYVFDQQCLSCGRAGCTYDVPEGCAHVPLRRDAGAFVGGWPTIACVGVTSQADAEAGCRRWGGTLARFESPADQAWVAQVAEPGQQLLWVGARVGADLSATWTATGAAVSPELLGGMPVANQCLALAADGRLYAVACDGNPEVAHRPYVCERRPR